MKHIEHQAYLALKAGAEVLEADAHGETVLRLSDGTILKLFRRKRFFTSAALYPYALRFARNAERLRDKQIPVPRVIATARIPSIERDAVHYQALEGVTLRQLLRQGIAPEIEPAMKKSFTEFIVHLHAQGIYFRSLHLGNVVLTPQGSFGLIDFSDLRLLPCSLPLFMRRRNIQRMLGIAGDRDWVDADAILAARGYRK